MATDAQSIPDDDMIGEELGDLAGGEVNASRLRDVGARLTRSARGAGARSVASGRWLVGIVLDMAPHIPIRDLPTLQKHYEGLWGDALAYEVVKNASRTTAALGAASGALIGVEELAPPAWLTIPIELLVETLAIAAVEMKLVAELHEVYGQPVRGTPTDRGFALAKAWADRRGVKAAAFLSAGGVADALGRGTKHEVMRQVRRRLMQRLGRSTFSAAPFLAGAAIGAAINRRGTRSLGEAVVRDLLKGHPPR